MIFLLEGCIELGLTASISALSLFSGPQKNNVTNQSRMLKSDSQFYSGDFVSNICMCLTLLGLFIAPFYMFSVARVYFNRHEEPEIKKKYGEMFVGLNVKTFPQLLYGLIFICRRLTMVLVLTYFDFGKVTDISFYYWMNLYLLCGTVKH